MDKAIEAAKLAFLQCCKAYQEDGECLQCQEVFEDQFPAAIAAYLAASGEARDKERLDWMSQQKSIQVNCRKGLFAINPSINYEYELLPLREAIDAAIAAREGKG